LKANEPDNESKSSSSESDESPNTNQATATKRQPSAFMEYVAHNRNAVKNENPGMSFMELSKKIADNWRQLNPEAKEHYQQLVQQKRIDIKTTLP